jgi:hypothetical protein
MRGWWAAFCAAAVIAACDDGGKTGGAGDPSDAARAVDAHMGVQDAAPMDAAPHDAAFLDANPPQPDAAPPPECEENARACLGGGAYRECRDGRWVIDECAAGQVCAGNEAACVPDPATCAAGTTVCLDGVPNECTGGSWTPMDACPEGTLCADGQCRNSACAVADARRSYLGCDYLAADLPNLANAPFGGTPDAPLGVVVANPDLSPIHLWARDAAGAIAPLVAQVTIPPPINVAGMYQPVTVQTERRDSAGQVVEQGFDHADGLEIPPRGMVVLLFHTHAYTEQTKVAPDAWRISTDAPVTATQFSPYCCNYSFTNDASLLLPISALGTDHRVIGVPSWVTWTPDENNINGGTGGAISATLTVIADKPATHVTVTLPPDTHVQLDPGHRLQRNGDVITATLGAGELMHLFTDGPIPVGPGNWPGVDLSGTRVESDQPVAVFSGHECTYYPQDQEACDHLEEQMAPVDTWGTQLMLVPVAKRGDPQRSREAVYWKILAANDQTTVQFSVPLSQIDPRPPGAEGVPDCRDLLDDVQTLRLDAGKFCEFGSDQAIGVTSDAPISAIGIISGQASTGAVSAFGQHAGDPSMLVAPPIRQLRASYEFLAPTTFFTDEVAVFAPAGSTFNLDGQDRPLVRQQDIPGTGWIFGYLGIADGPHLIQGSHPFGLLVFAYDDWVSYAFTGGLNLDKR